MVLPPIKAALDVEAKDGTSAIELALKLAPDNVNTQGSNLQGEKSQGEGDVQLDDV